MSNKPSPGPWKVGTTRNGVNIISSDNERIARVDANNTVPCMANANLMAASRELYDACDAADTAFAVLNISYLTPQARACVREAWPLVQQARAKAVPGSVYSEAIKEAQQNEIARLDGIVEELSDRLKDIENVLEGHPEVGTGNSKVHYAYYKAKGGSHE